MDEYKMDQTDALDETIAGEDTLATQHNGDTTGGREKEEKREERSKRDENEKKNGTKNGKIERKGDGKGARRPKKWLRRLLTLTIIGAMVPLLILLDVHIEGRPILIQVKDAPKRDVAIIFGAGYNAHSLSPILADRVATGVALYKSGKVRKLLMTGDNRAASHNEPAVMCRAAVKMGVPRKDIVLDFAGFRTYDSAYRARHIFGVQNAILVTQAYHLPRALFTAHALGIDAVGVVADRQEYGQVMLRYQVRELLASENAWVESRITHPRPRYLGRREHILP